MAGRVLLADRVLLAVLEALLAREVPVECRCPETNQSQFAATENPLEVVVAVALAGPLLMVAA